MMITLIIAICLCLAWHLYGQDGAVSTVEYEALRDLYVSTHGQGWIWRNRTEAGPEWFDGTSQPCATPAWQGLNCACSNVTGICTVDQIALLVYNMSGRLPDSFGNLTSLTRVDLSENNIYGPMPTTIGKLNKLTFFIVANNSFTGPIPSSLYDIRSMKLLALDFNQMTGSISSDIEKLTNLESIYINANHFSQEIPDELFSLPSLHLIDFYRNDFVGSIPSAIGNGKSLLQVDFSGNQLHGSIPREIGELSRLSNLHLEHNSLSGTIPEELYNCSSLKELVINNNGFNGTISSLISQLVNVEYVYFQSTYISGTIPEAVTTLPNLKYLYLYEMRLNGTIPSGLFDMPSLVHLYLNDNKFTGRIPENIGNLSQAVVIQLELNLLTGTIPASIGLLDKLKFVSLYDNYLTGTLPDTLGQMTELLELYFNGNFLNGTIDNLYACKELRIAWLYDNQFTGSISNGISEMKKLTDVILSQNFLNGTIPTSIESLHHLLSFEVDENDLEGKIPIQLYSLTNLTTLIISSNYFTGSVSPHIGNLTKLSYFIFNNNQMTGSIPESFTKLRHLVAFEGDYNSLTGHIPESVCEFGYFFSQFFMQYNMLSGPIPSCMFNSIRVDSLVVYNNMLTGQLPENISNHYLTDCLLSNNYLTGHLPRASKPLLAYFEVYNNALSGTLPGSFFLFGQYTQMALDTNYFTGKIPIEVNDAKLLNYLSLYNNLLTGTIPNLGGLLELTVFYVDNNFLSGPLNCFDSRIQTFLSNVDLSNNQFTGSLPEELFLIKSITAISSVQNCFVGTIPDVICNATGLTALALDGLHTAAACRYDLFNKNYALKYHTPGTIPTCIFNMPNLQTLHISGNGLGGSLPYNLSVSPSLNDIALSYNQLTGSIPLQLQLKSFFNYDLSYNNFNGVLLPFTQPEPLNGSVYLKVNRLSGQIPVLLKNIMNISILDGNIFECEFDRSQLPTHDDQSFFYECGTNQLNHSIYVFVFFLILSLVLSGVIFYLLRDDMKLVNEWITWLRVTAANVRAWWAVMTTHLEEYQNIAYMNKFFDNLRLCTLFLTALVAVILMPTYLGLSHQYSTYQYKYAWNVSSVYLSGFAPAVTLFVMYSLLIIVTFVAVYWVGSEFPLVDMLTNNRATMAQVVQKRYKHYFGLTGIAIFNFVVVLAINVGYVLASTRLSPMMITFIQLLLATFKLIWNDIVVRRMAKYMHQYLTKGLTLSMAEQRVWNSRYLTFNTYTLLFNVIIIPCIATAAVSTDCLYNTYVSPLNVVSTLTYQACIDFENAEEFKEKFSPNCTRYSDVSVYTTYVPPYIYRYQCSSTLVTTYAVIYVYKFILAAFFQPFFNLYLTKWAESMDQDTSLYKLIIHLVPKVKHRGPLGKSIKTYMFQPDRFSLRMIMFLAVFVTFGVIFPPLAVMICLTIFTQSYWTQLSLGRLIVRQGDAMRHTVMSYLNQDSANAGIMFKRTAYVIGGPAAFFYAFFLFDTYGDDVGGRQALWMTITMFVLGCCCVLVYRLLVNWHRYVGPSVNREGDQDKIELYGRPSASGATVSELGGSFMIGAAAVGGGNMKEKASVVPLAVLNNGSSNVGSSGMEKPTNDDCTEDDDGANQDEENRESNHKKNDDSMTVNPVHDV